MSEPRLISPMLDNFEMGGPISDHHGVRCCPAMRKNSDDKYIVKIISIPESQTKLDALILTGAFADNQSALSYFEELANGIVDEKKILDNLSNLEGFVAFEDCQIVSMDSEVGYDVYLISEYRKTLERQIAKTPMTQLSAVNLGLDLCSALSACRRSGYLFVDLKPSNIYIVGDKEYKIGDLGFVRLNSLKYESLLDKYRSCYTAPELEDVFAPLNDTMDIYSLGLILYQVFNGGALPFSGQQAPNQKFDAPAYADEEMAEIILKACDPDPASRWQDPVQMGQALVSYMQKNGVNDTPLTSENFGLKEDPVLPVEEETESVAETDLPLDVIVEENTLQESQTVEAESDVTETPEETVAETIQSISESIEMLSAAEDVSAEASDEPAADEMQDDLSEIPAEEQTLDVESDVAPAEECPEVQGEDVQIDDILENIDATGEEYENLSFLNNLDNSEQILADVGDDYEGISDETSDILDQIDALTAHDVPSPVVAPDPIEIKIPDPLPIEDNSEDTDEAEPEHSDEKKDAASDEAVDEVESLKKELPEEEMPYVPKKKRTGLVWGIIIALLLTLAAGGYYFYSSYYLQPIHALTLEGSENNLQVLLTADVDETLLTVVCADSHGNKVTAPVVGGKAAFSGLTPDTAYTVTIEIGGLHKLTGTTSKVYSTPVQTKIVQVGAITGAESGSVIISFAVEGPDSEQWNVIYNADGEAERVTTFSDHMVTLTGLTVGKEYLFRLEPVADIYISGETEISYIAKNLICAENLRVTSFTDGDLTAQWDTPAGESVAQWSIRCYNDTGYSETLTTEENLITFSGLDENSGYTIEITAADMSVQQRVSIGANAVMISDYTADVNSSGILSATWSSNRDVPADGWSILYTVNGIGSSETLNAEENAIQIPVVPNGSYEFTIMDNSGNEVLGGPFTYIASGASDFDAFGITKDIITARLCKTPEESEWDYKDLSDEDYVNSFASGDKISLVLSYDGDNDESDDDVLITYAVYSEDGELVKFSHETQNWIDMWDENYCELDVSAVPVEAGRYNVIIYFNGAEAGSQKFEITA